MYVYMYVCMYVFRKNGSTISTTAKFIDDILLGMNEKQYTEATFIDLKKAFDTINHQILIKKLPHFGINNNIVLWIQNYLTNRKQKCTVNGRTSNKRSITYVGSPKLAFWAHCCSCFILMTLIKS